MKRRTPFSEATTVSLGSGRASLTPGGMWLSPGDVVESPETGSRYEIERLIGAGGFGQAYRARRRGRNAGTVCIKISPHIDGWIREAYFGRLLEGQERAIRVYDVFPRLQRSSSVFYCLALEYAPHGDLRAHLRRSREGWSETKVRREIAGILGVLGRLHRGQMLHRDLTPMNVFVCEGRRLKLGDFGIVRQQGDRRGVTARTLNASMAPSDIIDGAVPKWQARDDVYQVGQLLGMLVRGDAGSRLRTGEVRRLDCSDHLKEIIYRCIGERRKRYESADEMIEALRHAPKLPRAGALRSLKGVHLSFTGFLSVPRTDAARAARRAGAVVHGGPSAKTTVVVRGRPNALQAAGRDAGRKLMEIKRLREKGHRIALIDEARFWRLAGGPPPKPRRHR